MRADLETRLRSQRNFPTPPQVAEHILALARDSETEIAAVANAIAKDPGLAAKLMRTANSALYAERRRSHNLRQALLMLGLNTAITLALGFSVVSVFKEGKSARIDYPRYWRRSLLLAMATRALGKEAGLQNGEDLFLAGLLQDIGILALDRAEPNLYANLPADASMIETLAYERARLGDDHAGIGAWLLKSWNLPAELCQAVALSHTPDRAERQSTLGRTCRCVAVSNEVADFFLNAGRRAAMARITSRAHEFLGLSPAQIGNVIEEMKRLLPEIEGIFDARIVDAETAAEITLEAQELIAERSLESLQKLSELQHATQSLVARTELLEDTVRRDALTGVFNRGHLDQQLRAEFAAALQNRWPLALLFVDLDHFKTVNDNHGHAAGDAVLRATAQLLVRQVRGGDTVTRYGGEEFVVLLPGVDPAGAQEVGQRILRALRASPHEIGRAQLTVTSSLGLAVHGAGVSYADADALIAAADAALYAAKQSGRDRLVIASSGAVITATPAAATTGVATGSARRGA
jgi:diguanylate cyclase (GGDEF)-like protein